MIERSPTNDRRSPPAVIPSSGGAKTGHRMVAVALALIVVIGIGARLNGLLVSFWMDEAWVANSLIEPTWAGVFYYPHWLQTSPPGFLALAASTVAVFGHSHLAFRLLPLVAALLGFGLVIWKSRRLTPAFGLLAVTVLALSPTAIDYSRMLKQYSTDLAVAALLVAMAWRYVEQPSGRRFAALAATLGGGLACAYGAVFTACGVLALTSPVFLLVTGRRPSRTDILRWIALIAVMGIVLAVEYAWFYLPNNSPELRRFWQVVSINRRDSGVAQVLFRNLVVLVRHTPVPVSLHAIAVLTGAAGVALGVVLGVIDRARRPLTSIVVCLGALPPVALVLAGWLDVYPNFERTSLFLLPGLALLAGCCAQNVYYAAVDLSRRRRAGRWLPHAVGALLVVAGAVMALDGTRRGLATVQPREEYAASMRYLREQAADGDLVFVHACCEEGFRLYRTLEPWATSPVIAVGETGQPCCPRNKPVVKKSLPAVGDDIRRHLTAGFRGRVWLFYTDRLDYWRYSSLAPEGPVLRAAVEAAGCQWRGGQQFTAIRVDLLDCSR